jgi:hypothetical protein
VERKIEGGKTFECWRILPTAVVRSLAEELRLRKDLLAQAMVQRGVSRSVLYDLVLVFQMLCLARKYSTGTSPPFAGSFGGFRLNGSDGRIATFWPCPSNTHGKTFSPRSRPPRPSWPII